MYRIKGATNPKFEIHAMHAIKNRSACESSFRINMVQRVFRKFHMSCDLFFFITHAGETAFNRDPVEVPTQQTRQSSSSWRTYSWPWPWSPRTPLLPRSLPQATGPSGSPQWCRPQADPPAPARHRPVREPAQDCPQNSRPPTPKPQPQSSTNTTNL